MSFNRDLRPEPLSYFESRGLVFRERRGTWRTTRCEFHGGSDSMRINTPSGGWCCMACGAKGGDVVSYEQQISGCDFMTACKRLGCWIDDGKTPERRKPAPLPARDALAVLRHESTLVAIEGCRAAHGEQIDKDRLLTAAGRIGKLAEAFR